MKRPRFSLILKCLFALSFASVGATKNTNSNVVRTQLAGTNLEDKGQFYKFDSQEHYYLAFQKDGAGHVEFISLKLCPDRKQVCYPDGELENREISAARLPRLRTGKGINIGDTPRQVLAKIGEEPEYYQYNRKTKTRIYTYKAPIFLKVRETSSREKWNYEGIYKFKNERLWDIEYTAAEPYHGQ